MMKIREGIGFNDVLVVPISSNVSSRDDVNISTKLSKNLTLEFPLIASPMPGIVNASFAHSLSELGGMAILHRFYQNRAALFDDIFTYLWKDDVFGVSIKVGEEDIGEYFEYNPNVILIDTANGYNRQAYKYAETVANYIYTNNITCDLMAGNVVTRDGCLNLYNAGCDIIRVGIGGGSVCSTRNQTGIGVPNITAIDECKSDDYSIVIDGGIRTSGDFVKSIVAGANAGMSGRLFGECYESPNKGRIYGAASRTNMKKNGITPKSVEGIDIDIEKKHSLETFVKEFGYGIKSAGTYLDASNLKEIRANAEFIRVYDGEIKRL